MSEELKKYVRSYKEWLDEGAPNFKPFRRGMDINYNILNYRVDFEELNLVMNEMHELIEWSHDQNPNPFHDNDEEFQKGWTFGDDGSNYINDKQEEFITSILTS